MTQVISNVLEPAGILVSIGAFSGPSFAIEVAQGQPTAVTVAFSDFQVAQFIQQEFSSETLRLYTSSDVIGVELGGALKNVIAIAAGIAVGVGLGHNSTAALITRGIAEMTRLAVACGGSPQTLAGLSGVGDLVLTCTGSLSRNRTVGQALGRAASSPKFSRVSAEKSLKASSPPVPPSNLLASTMSKCPSPSRWNSSSNRAKIPAKPSAN